MLLTKISVENFGQFRDRCTFDLKTKGIDGITKPILLFGGNNGAGKTTLFDAFRLCLYGKALPEFRLNKINYDDYVIQKIHRHKNSGLQLQQSAAVVTIEFEYAQLGDVNKYQIERRWRRTNENRLDEELEVRMDDKPLESVEASHWQEFVNELIPIGVSNLFFFDGERIQALAEDKTDEMHLKQSFYSLLGLDLVDRLRSDLHLRLNKTAKESDQEFGNKLETLEAEKNNLITEKENILQENAQLNNLLTIKKKEAHYLEDKISGEGGTFARKRDELKKKQAQLEVEIEQTRKAIIQLCEGLLPFSFVPGYCKSLRERLLKEEEQQSILLAARHVERILNEIEKQTIAVIKSETSSKLTAKRLTVAVRKIIKGASDRKTSDKGTTNLIHHLSPLEEHKILAWIDSVLSEIPGKTKELSLRLEALTDDLQLSGDLLSKAPADDVIGPMIQNLNSINQEIGKTVSQVSANIEKIKLIDFRLLHVNAGIRELDKEKGRFEKLGRGIALAARLKDALGEYEERLKKEKLQELATSLTECLNYLMHKDIFAGVVINSESFAVTLYDHDGNDIPKERLSAGEKQMYAIAILWALAKTSGRPLPFIIDTPLARLDSGHRLNLVQNFFPIASHQVIIFSTDTEVDKEYFVELSAHIARSYKLEYNRAHGMTEVKEGYFWNTNKANEMREGGEKDDASGFSESAEVTLNR